MNAFWQAPLADTLANSSAIARGPAPTLDAAQWLAQYAEEAPTSSNQGSAAVAFQRWFHFKEAFSPKFVADTLASLPYQARSCIDPFGGSGTTALTSRMLGLSSTTVEVNPFLADLIEAKLTPVSPAAFRADYERTLAALRLEDADRRLADGMPTTMTAPGVNGRFVFSSEVFATARALVRASAALRADHARLLRVLLGSVLVQNSNVTINGKGRRYRRGWAARERTTDDLIESLDAAVDRAVEDITSYAGLPQGHHTVLRGDARTTLRQVETADVAILSPPYPNSFDYTDVYNLELWMLDYLRSGADNRALRRETLRSHVDRKIALPTIGHVELNDFDLYSRARNIAVEIERPVFCLIGANGLGKSTFLNTVNYAITGAIPDPTRRFQSAQDYMRDTSRPDRAEDYFGGRLSDEVRATATATVRLDWPRCSIAVTREVLGTEGVIRIETVDAETGVIEVSDASDGASGDLETAYRRMVLDETGLEDFAQFVFLTHFVATFDEGRHLLMWDDAALTNALYLAFGADPADARAADRLQHEMDRESSRGRNVRFSARHVTERIDQLADLLAKGDQGDHASDKDLLAEHQRLRAQLAQAEDRARRKRTELRDAEAKWVELSAQVTEMQLEYRRLFSSRLQNAASVDHHPLVRNTLADDRCALCGTDHVKAVVAAHLEARECQLCDSPLADLSADGGAIQALEDLDLRIAKTRDELGARLDARQRVADQLEAAEASQDGFRSELDAFREAEAGALARTDSGGDFSAIQNEVNRLEKERSEFIKQSKAHYAKRDELREKLHVHERRLRAQYEVGSLRFVPRFRELAEAFIGLVIDVELDHRQSVTQAGFGLRLQMGGQLRLQPEDVSESQRFFIDIALRMALAEFMSTGPATLLIDTPEGSLDIAYEARAGIMFANFVEQGNRLMMTANLRSSELILRLANLQKTQGMQIAKMTAWTDLSEVQLSEEKLFTKAYEDIEAAMQ